MTILALIAVATFVGAGLSAKQVGPDWEPPELDLDLD